VRKTSFEGNPLESRDSLTSALSQHVYCCANDPENCKSERNYGELSRVGLKKCKSYVENLITTRSDEANKIGVPLFISEFGACSGSSTCAQEIDYVVSMADAHALSWTYYQFKGFGDYST